jgi:hypothetical protein
LNEMKKLNKFCIDFLFVKIGKKNQLQWLLGGTAMNPVLGIHVSVVLYKYTVA